MIRCSQAGSDHFVLAKLRRDILNQGIAVAGAMSYLERAAAGTDRKPSAWRTVLADQGSPYRPELHYMRGPGPKWREARVRLRDPR